MNLDVIDPWYAAGLRFECTQCGNCCTGGPGYVWISDAEIDRLARHLGLSQEDTIQQYCRPLGERFSLREQRNAAGLYDCIFLKEVPWENAAGEQVQHSCRICTIYPVRPLQCRTWPFWEGNLANEENWRRAGQRCPGIGRGPVRDRQHIESHRDADDWPD